MRWPPARASLPPRASLPGAIPCGKESARGDAWSSRRPCPRARQASAPLFAFRDDMPLSVCRCSFGKSLNKEYRKRELMRITEENLQILRRIQHKEP